MMNVSFSFRGAGSDDRAFLLELYETTREGEFKFLDPAARRQLMQMQCAAQEIGYTSQFPGSEHLIILNAGEMAGRVWIARSERELRILDISLLPRHRRLGIGTAAYRRVMAEADATHKVVAACVFKTNAPSLAFHRSLGFAVTGEDQLAYALERAPEAESA